MRWVTLVGCFVTGSLLFVGCGGSTTTDATDGGSDAATTGDGTATDTSGGTDTAGGTDTGTGASDAPKSDAGNYCTDLAARAAKCGKPFDAAKCAAQVGCYTKVLKPEDAEIVMGCFSKSDCSTSEDSCLVGPAGKYASDPTTQAYAKTCLDKRAACKDATTGTIPFSDDLCSFYHGMFNASYLSAAQACFSKPCAEVKGCYDAVFKAAGCG